MNKQNLFSILLFIFSINIAHATPFTYSTGTLNRYASETNGDQHISLGYTPIVNTVDISSAILTVYLKDDLTTVFTPSNIDAPREFARLHNVKDGSLTASADLTTEVDPHLFSSNDPNVIAAATALTALGVSSTDLATNAASAGIENPSVVPSTAGYFNLDVTSLIKGSNSGMLEFDLMARNFYSDISSTDPVYALIVAAAQSVNPNYSAPNSFPVFEDFIIDSARLTINVPEPSINILLMLGMLVMMKSYKLRRI